MVLLLAAAVAISLLVAVARNQRRRHALDAATVDLTIDDEVVRRTLGDGRVEQVRWDQLVEVEVMTVDSGPHAAAGAVLVLAGSEGGCLAPLDPALIDRLHQLPGFDGPAFLAALQLEPPSRTSCWIRA